MEKSGRDKENFLFNESTLPIIERLSEGIPGGFFIYHADGDEELIYINQAMLRIFGCSTEEEFRTHTGNSFRGIVHPDDLEDVERSIMKQIEVSQYNLDYVEYRIIRKDGTVRWVEDYGHFMSTHEYGDIFYVFIDDATERLTKRLSHLEEINGELRKAYAQVMQYKRAILHDAVAFFEVDLTKDEFITYAAQVVNGKVVGLFDSAGIPHFKKYSEYVDYWSRQIMENEVDKYREFFNLGRLGRCCEEGDVEQVFESWVIDVFGRKRLYRYTLLLGRNELTGDVIALSTTKDITDSMERQRLFEIAVKQANAASIARSTFLNNISHDIKTPLNGIIGYADLMLRHLGDQEKLREYIGKIKLSGKQLHTFLDKSLEITRIESGKAVLCESECHLIDILGEVEKTILPEARAKRIRFLVDKNHISHFSVIADCGHVKEILCQILDNAIKYTPEGGMVTLSLIELEEAPNGYAKYQFIIEDTGIGIKEDFLSRLFEPFEREKNSTQSGVFGGGLGLPIVKSLVEMMSGTIKATSRPGEGSTFTVSLIFRLQGQDSLVKPGSASDGGVDLTGKKILLVEDNEINREIEEELLSELGFVIDTAYDGAVAFQKVRDSSPGTYDVILMDIQMPVMDGYESARAIRALDDPKLASIPIIAVSANAFSEDQEKSLESGMNAHCPKPIDIQHLYDMITSVLLCA